MKKTAQLPSLFAQDTTCALTSERFAELMAFYRDRAYRLAYRHLLQRPDAEDALQEALLRAWSARSSFRGDEAGFWAWFSTIVVHVSISLLRRQRLAQQLGILGADEEPLLAEVPDSDLPPDEIVLLREFSQDLQAAVMSLPKKLRAVVLLHYFEELKCQEVADQLGVNLSAVKTRLWRAQGQLRTLLADAEVAVKAKI